MFLQAFLLLAAEFTFTPPRAQAVRVEVEFLKPHRGERLELYAAGQKIYAADRFVGAVALVRYRCKSKATIRESVTVLEQGPDLGARPPFARTVKFVDGLASDIQLFGYEGAEAPSAEEVKRYWRRFRQELFFDGATRPFAVLEWVHALDGIRLLSAKAQ